jgi:hypothetical protein
VWTYRLKDGSLTAAISLDYPFLSFHDLSVCYKFNGYLIEEGRDVPGSQSADPRALDYHEFDLSKSRQHKHGRVLFTEFYRDGTLLEPSTTIYAPSWSRLIEQRLQSRLGALRHLFHVGPAVAVEGGPVFQVQLFAETYRPLSAAEHQELQTLFLQCAGALRDRSVALLAGGH